MKPSHWLGSQLGSHCRSLRTRLRALPTQRQIGINFIAVGYQPFCFCVSFSDSFYKTMDTYQRFLKYYTSTRPRCSVTLCFPHLLNVAICVPYVLDYLILMLFFRMMLIFNNLAYTFEIHHGSCHITSVQLIMMFCIESTPGVASFSNFNAINMPFLNLPLTTGDVHRTIGYTVPYPFKYKNPRIPFGCRRASGNKVDDRNLMFHGYTASFASWDIVTTLLTSVVIPCQLQLRTLYTRNFADVYTHIYIVNYDLKLLMMLKHTTTCFTN